MFRATVPAATVISRVLNFGQVICRLGDNYRVWLSRVLESGPHTQRPNPDPIFLEVLPPQTTTYGSGAAISITPEFPPSLPVRVLL